MRVFHIPQRRIGPRQPELSSPWESGHASPEDRALGYELELIELTRQRSELDRDSEAAALLDAEIAAVKADLVRVAIMPDLPNVA